MRLKFHILIFIVGVALSLLSLWTLRGCGHYFETGLFWLLSYSEILPHQLGRGGFAINTIFHGLSLVFGTWLVSLALRRVLNPAQSKLASVAAALVIYILLMFVLFPIRECTL